MATLNIYSNNLARKPGQVLIECDPNRTVLKLIEACITKNNSSLSNEDLARWIFLYFVSRIKNHVAKVQACATYLRPFFQQANCGNLFNHFITKVQQHDFDKFSGNEHVTMYALHSTLMMHRGLYKMSDRADKAYHTIELPKHWELNDHHPEHYMKLVDTRKDRWAITDDELDRFYAGHGGYAAIVLAIAEMVADWSAVGLDMGNTAKEWWLKNQGVRWSYGPKYTDLLEECLEHAPTELYVNDVEPLPEAPSIRTISVEDSSPQLSLEAILTGEDPCCSEDLLDGSELSEEKLFISDKETLAAVKSATKVATKTQLATMLQPGDMILTYRKMSKKPLIGKIVSHITSHILGSSFGSIKMVAEDGQHVYGYGLKMGLDHVSFDRITVKAFFSTCSGMLVLRNPKLTDDQKTRLFAWLSERVNKVDYSNKLLIKSLFTHLLHWVTGDITTEQAKNYFRPMFCSTIFAYAMKACNIETGLSFGDASTVWPRDWAVHSNWKPLYSYIDPAEDTKHLINFPAMGEKTMASAASYTPEVQGEYSTEKYDPPYTEEQMRQNGYSEEVIARLKSDNAHAWRMKTGIELIHVELTKSELMRIWKNWQQMSSSQKKQSDEMCMHLFGQNNKSLYEYLLPQYKTEQPGYGVVRYPFEVMIQGGYVYHASPLKVDKLRGKFTGAWSGEQGNVFVTQFKGIASCFVVSKHDISEAVEQQVGGRVLGITFNYSPWDMTYDEMRHVYKEITIGINVRGLKPITFEKSGYLYKIDYMNKYRGHTHMFKGRPDVQFIIEGDVDYVSCEKISVKFTLVEASEEVFQKRGTAKVVKSAEEALATGMFTLDDIRSVDDLKAFYKQCKYDIIDPTTDQPWHNHHKEIEESDYFKCWRLLSPEEVIKYGCGICYDTVLLTRTVFDRLHVQYKSFFAGCYDEEVGLGPTHTFIVYKDGSQWKWMEGSWGPYKNNTVTGTSLEDVVSQVVAFLAKTAGKKQVLYEMTKYPTPGCSMHEFDHFVATCPKYTKFHQDLSVESVISPAIKLYHLSYGAKIESKQLTPRVPDNEFVKWGVEDGTTPRICFATSISKATLAMGRCQAGQELQVYEVDYSTVDKSKLLKALVTPTKEQVPDASITKEVWCTIPVTVKYTKTIKLTDIKHEYTLKFTRKDGTEYVGHPREWNYEEVSGSNESYSMEAAGEEGLVGEIFGHRTTFKDMLDFYDYQIRTQGLLSAARRDFSHPKDLSKDNAVTLGKKIINNTLNKMLEDLDDYDIKPTDDALSRWAYNNASGNWYQKCDISLKAKHTSVSLTAAGIKERIVLFKSRLDKLKKMSELVDQHAKFEENMLKAAEQAVQGIKEGGQQRAMRYWIGEFSKQSKVFIDSYQKAFKFFISEYQNDLSKLRSASKEDLSFEASSDDKTRGPISEADRKKIGKYIYHGTHRDLDIKSLAIHVCKHRANPEITAPVVYMNRTLGVASLHAVPFMIGHGSKLSNYQEHFVNLDEAISSSTPLKQVEIVHNDPSLEECSGETTGYIYWVEAKEFLDDLYYATPKDPNDWNFVAYRPLPVAKKTKVTVKWHKKYDPEFASKVKSGHASVETMLLLSATPQERKLNQLAKPYYVPTGKNSWEHVQQDMGNAVEIVRGTLHRDLFLKEYAAILFHDCAVKVRNSKDHHAEYSAELARPVLAKTGYFTEDELNEITTAIAEHDENYNTACVHSSETSEVLVAADFNPPNLAWMLNKSYSWGLAKGLDHDGCIRNCINTMPAKYGSHGTVTYPKLYMQFYKDKIKAIQKALDNLTYDEAERIIMDYRARHHLAEGDQRLPDPSLEVLSYSAEASSSSKIAQKKKKILDYICKLCDTMEPSGVNSKRYQQIIGHMNDKEFDQFMNYMKEGKWQLHIVAPNMVINLKNEDLLKACDLIGLDLFQRVWMHDFTTGRKYLTDNKYMFVKLPVRRQQQFLDEKLSVPDNDRTIDGLTGQVTGDSRACSLTNPEIHILAARGLDHTLKELVNIRGGNIHGYGEFRRMLEENGEGDLDRVDPNSRTRSAVVGGVLLQAMMLGTNL